MTSLDFFAATTISVKLKEREEGLKLYIDSFSVNVRILREEMDLG